MMETAMMETATTTIRAMITLDEVLQAVFPPEGLLRLVGGSGGDRFFRRSATGAWTASARERTVRLDEFIAARRKTNVKFSPVAWRAPGTPSPIAGVACVWAGITDRLAVAKQPNEPGLRVLSGAIDRARTRLIGAGWFPSVLINEGDRLTAFWALERPLTNPAHLQWLLRRLATRLDGDRDLADPATALVRVPGSELHGLDPSPTVTVERCSGEQRYTVAEIERLIERASAGRPGSNGARVEMEEAQGVEPTGQAPEESVSAGAVSACALLPHCGYLAVGERGPRPPGRIDGDVGRIASAEGSKWQRRSTRRLSRRTESSTLRCALSWT